MMINNKTFEEKFPSFKNCRTDYGHSGIKLNVVSHEDISKHCQDNKTIKEAIKKVSRFARLKEDIPGCIRFEKDLLKELGLEGE